MYIAELDPDQINDKIWRGEYWGRDGALELARLRYDAFIEEGKKREAISPLSSVYYSAAGNARKHAERRGWLNPARYFWLLRAWNCLKNARWLSDELFETVGYHGMTADELDIRQSILRKGGGAPGEILECIEHGLEKELAPHTRALLLLGAADAMLRMGAPDSAEANAFTAEEIAWANETLQPKQAIRIFRGAAEVFEKTGQKSRAARLRERSLELAERHSPDQLFKMS